MEKKIIIAEYALAYCKLGFHVIPIEWRKVPGREKRPLIKWEEFQDRPATEAEVAAWWHKWPEANIGVVTGEKSGLLVVDIESAEGYEAFREKYGELPKTFMQKTGRESGIHVIVKHPRDGRRYQNRAKVIKDCDSRADGGYILIAPSLHPSGKRYEAIGDILKDGFDLIAECPEHIKPFFNPIKVENQGSKKKKDSSKATQENYDKKNPDGWVQDYMNGVDEGERNEWAAKLGGWYLRKFDGDVDQVKAVMRGLNQLNRPPLEWKELDKVLDSISSRCATDAMGNAVGDEIDKLETLHYPDGSRKYNVYLKNVEGYAQMSMHELGQFSLFKWRFSEIAGHIPAPIKQGIWEEKVNKALAESEKKFISEEETNLGVVISAIDRAMDSKDTDDNLKHLNTRLILIGDNGDRHLFLKINVLMTLLKFEGEKLSRTQVGEILRKLGFDNKAPVRLESGSVRAWGISQAEWKLRRSRMMGN